MPSRLAMGEIPKVPHTAFRSSEGSLRFEHCLTTRGFEGPYSILYHQRPPHRQAAVDVAPEPLEVVPSADRALRKRHFVTSGVALAGPVSRARLVLGGNDDVVVSVATPTASDEAYRLEADHDRLVFVAEGRGICRSVFGDLAFETHDYLVVPRGVVHRLVLQDGGARFLEFACASSLDFLPRHRNDAGQFRMDAPIGHRDLRTPTFVGPLDEGLRDLEIHRDGEVHRFVLDASPLDVVGWDGAVYPFVLPIRAYRPRVGAVHLPPDGNGTFAARGVLVSSFVPRPLDFAEGAIPCPYPHTSVDCDELIYYASGEFLSRRGIAAGSVTLHPRGLPHGPHVAAYESSIGRSRVDEIAVMLDLDRPFVRAAASASIEDPDYHASYLGEPR